jgi:acyl carrier protein
LSEDVAANSVEHRVNKVFKEALKLDAAENAESIIYNEIQGWDSVGHMMLVAGLEQEFDCMLEMDDILDMSSYQKAVEIMDRYSN